MLQQFTLGISSLSKLGPIGAIIEVVVILYLATTSGIGLYGLPGVRKVKPQFHSTPLTHLIANCALFLVLSSALPLLSRILGVYYKELSCSYSAVCNICNIFRYDEFRFAGRLRTN